MIPVPDPYRLLGVKHGATVEEIKAAHRSLAKRYHPDAAESDTRRFLAVQEAYQLLSDPLRRREWDARHAPGPVRAGEGVTRPGTAGGRSRGASDSGRSAGRGSDGAGTPGAAGPGPAADPGRRPAGDRPSGAPGAGPAGYDERSDAGGPWTASDRDPASRSYTWSAAGVPWWEDHGPREARRPPGTKRPSGAAPRATGQAGAPRSGPTGPDRATARPPAGAPPIHGRRDGGRDEGATSDPGTTANAAGRAAGTPEGDEPTAGQGGATSGRPASEFDVYSRSSGAAWSSAARAYFRRSDAELPRRGVFRMEGTTPVTGAAARRAAEQEAARERGFGGNTDLAGAGPGHVAGDGDGTGRSGAERTGRPPGPAPAAGHASAPGRPDTPGRRRDTRGRPDTRDPLDTWGRPDTGRPDARDRSDTPGRSDAPGHPDQARPASADTAGDRAPGTTASGQRRAGPPPPAGQRQAPRSAAPPGWSAPPPAPGGSTTTLGTMSGPSLTASFRAAFERGEPWPTVGERITFATLAWVPFALLVAYGGGWISGCDRAAASCSEAVQPIQSALIAASLVAFVLLPHVAYFATWGALGLAITGLLLAVPATLLGNRAPIPAILVALGLGMLAAGYLAGAVLAARDRPLARPWTLPARRRPSGPPRPRR